MTHYFSYVSNTKFSLFFSYVSFFQKQQGGGDGGDGGDGGEDESNATEESEEEVETVIKNARSSLGNQLFKKYMNRLTNDPESFKPMCKCYSCKLCKPTKQATQDRAGVG